MKSKDTTEENNRLTLTDDDAELIKRLEIPLTEEEKEDTIASILCINLSESKSYIYS